MMAILPPAFLIDSSTSPRPRPIIANVNTMSTTSPRNLKKPDSSSKIEVKADFSLELLFLQVIIPAGDIIAAWL